jgi:hypothetical protein
MSKRPTLHEGPASRNAGPGEIIWEFSDDRSGGLISIRRVASGKLRVEIYHCDDDVEVIAMVANLPQATGPT